jgi:RNA polymerase sigma factor (sigma-70 family)
MFGRLRKKTAETHDLTSLLKASLQGSTQAFETIVGRYQSLVCAITYSGTGSVEKSEELAQETFLRAWKSLDQLQDPAKFRPWLCSIARSTVQNWFRSRRLDVVGKAGPLDSAVEKASEEAGPVEAAMRKEQQAVVAHALGQVPESLREPLILFYREQKSVREVAEQLGLSESAARQRISRARNLLREQVADMVEETIARTKPGKAFTTAVIAAVAATAVRTTTTAVAATGVAAVMAGSSGTTALLSGVTAKVVALAAGVVIVAGGVVAYKHLARPEQPPAVGSRLPVDASARHDLQPEAGESQASAAAPPSAVPPENQNSALRIPNSELVASPADRDRARAAATVAPVRPYEFAPKGVLSGVITDIDTGEPVRDARVQISMSWIEETRTDANGFYSFDKVRAPGACQVAVSSQEYVGIGRDDRSPAIYLSNDKQAVKHFQLPKACMVDVWVVDSNGVPISGTNVVITSLADDRSREIGDSIRLRQTDPNGYILLGGIPSAQTDYLITAWRTRRLPAEPQARGRFTRSEHDFAPAGRTIRLTDPNVIKQVQITLQEGQTVTGYAEYADGVSAKDIGISARPTWWHCNYSVLDNPVNADGTFSLKHIAPGAYDISMYVPRPDFSGGTSTVVAQAQLPPADGQPLIVRLPGKSPQSLASISGKLIFVGEKKPDNVQISAYSPTGGSAFADIMRGPDGKLGDTFVLNRLEPGTYTLQFSGTGVEEKTLRDVVAPSEGLEVELMYAAKCRLTGTVTDRRTGAPIKGFRVRARKLHTLRGPNYVQPERWTHLENEQGQFAVDTVGPGVYQVQAVAEGYAPLWSEEINTDLPKPAAIALSPGGTIAGMVVNAQGEPVDAAKVIPLSLAGGAMPTTKDTFVCEEGAVTTAAGAFTLKNLPPGTETLKVTHPDYVFAIVGDVRVAEDSMTDNVRITLTAGGTVEGYVYDNRGAPQAAQTLYFQDDSAYGGTGDREAGRLGTAVTDSNGFYRAVHLPETLSYVSRANEWSGLGVVRRTVVPTDGATLRLDFGGLPLVSGAAVVDGVPLADTRLLLGPTDSPHFGAFRCLATSDEHGAFVFAGITRGTHAIYYERPDKRNDWLKIATVTVAGADMNLGVIPRDVSGLMVTIDAAQAGPAWLVRDVFITDSERPTTVAPFRTAEAPTSPGGPWRIDSIGPGRYTLTATRADGVRWQTKIDLKAAEGPWQITLTPPRSAASVSGRVLGDANWLALWREGKDIWSLIVARNGEEFSVAGLPAGKYVIGNDPAFLSELPALLEFTLGEGESKRIDVQPNTRLDEMGFLVALVVDEKGLPRNDVRAWLEGPHGTVEPLERSLSGYCFTAVPGKYTLHVQAAGYRPSGTEVTLRPYVQPSGSTEGRTQKVTIRLQP